MHAPDETRILALAGKASAARPYSGEQWRDYQDAKARFLAAMDGCDRTTEAITLRMLAALVVASDDTVEDKARMLHWLADNAG